MVEKTCIKPKSFMFIVTIICGFIVLGLSFYLFIFSVIQHKIFYIILSILACIIAITEIIKMCKYKIIIDKHQIQISTQKFSYKSWQHNSQTILFSNIKSIKKTNFNILITTESKTIRIWILPFSKKQIDTIISSINSHI